ncbi:phage tail tape measure protein [Pseudacidovorax intermedius]|uniref:Tail length tape measure protein n=1 Tax=Pseudacidovorax intermedius TaxID=433924 RepID=A0A147GWZ0_9BURK|nr:phage tail tape measure protein [Pseudacidovorax intermedius]KTT21902.1 hypothetical protein NS331_11115 [Pseudacidovorax intermedius]
MTVDATSVSTQLPAAGAQFDRFAATTEASSRRATQAVARVNMSVTDLVRGAAGLTVVAAAVGTVTSALSELPQRGLAFTSEVEVAQLGMAGILRSMTAVNGQQTQWNDALRISGDIIGKLNDDALRTAASSQELVGVFQALLGPGLAARMTLDQVRELTVVGTNAVKSLGLSGGQVVQELRDLVQGGITASGSSLATALGLKDEDIAKAKASSEGLFAFLMSRLKGFKDSSESYGSTLKGSFEQLQEGATRLAADGMKPLTDEIKKALQGASDFLVVTNAAGQQQINPTLVAGLQHYAESAAKALSVGRDVVQQLWEHREAIGLLMAAYKAFRIGQWAAEAAAAVQAKMELSQADRLARVEAAASQAADAQAVTSSRAKVTALLAELAAKQASAEADVAAAAAQRAQLVATNEAIAISRAEVLAKMESARATMAQAQAQIQAAQAAGAQSFALAAVRDGTVALSAAQQRHAALMTELAVLGQQQARVNAQITATTVAQAAAQDAAAAAAGRLGAATGAASLASRSFGLVVGALGGPVGIAIMAVAGLAMWLYRLKSAADDAAKTGLQIQRAEKDAASGKVPEMRDVAAMEAELSRWKDRRDELIVSGKKSMTEWVNGAPVKSTVESLDAGIANLEERLGKVRAASTGAAQGQQQLTLTVEGARQAWRKANGDVKTSASIQEEYTQKLHGSQTAFQQYLAVLEKNGATESTIQEARKRQALDEAGLKAERDKALKSLSADGVSTEKRGLEAQIAAVEKGYKLKALAITDGMDEVDSLVKRDLMSDYAAVGRRRELQLLDLKNREDALLQKIALKRKEKDSEKEVASLQGELAELPAQRRNIDSKAARDQEELLVAPQIAQLKALRQTIDGVRDQATEQERANAVIGKAKTAVNDLTIAYLERQQAELEGSQGSTAYVAALEERIAAEKRLRAAVGAGEGLQLAQDWKDKQREEARKMSEDTRSMFIQGVNGLLSSDANVFESLGSSLRNTIISAVAGAFYDALLKDAVDNFTKLVSSELRKAISPGGDSSGASFGLSLLKGASSIYSSGLSGNAAAAAASSIGGSDTLGTMIGLMGLVKPSAKGNVFDGAAGLSSYVNTLVDRPTVFPFAKGGIGLMGEAGTEGIFPLRRDSQGRLGVIGMSGGQGGAPLHYAPTTHFHLDSRVDRGAAMADAQRLVKESDRRQFERLQRLRIAPE